MVLRGHGHKRVKQCMVGTLSAVALLGVAAVPAHAESARSQQWHLNAMDADEMWKVSKGEGVTVAVIDTGVNSSISDLKGQVLPGKDFTGLPGGPLEDYGDHGTMMAALVAATGKAGTAKGTYGLAPDAKILPLRMDDENEDAANAAEADRQFASTLAAAIRYAANSEAKVLNISMATESRSTEVQKAVDYALAKGKLIFAGVGNSGKKENPVMYPAAIPGVVGVSAIDKKVLATDESEKGAQVDLAAPGDEIVASCDGGSELCRGHGTSAATALASASAALIWSKHPGWTANQVTRVLVNTAGRPKSGAERNDFIGYGVVRPRVALKDPGSPGDPKTNPLPGPYNEDDAKAAAREKAGEKAEGDRSETSASKGEDGISVPAVVGMGVAAAVVLGAAVAVPVVVRRRRAAQPTSPPAGPYAYSGPPQWQDSPPPPQRHPDDRHQRP